MKDKFIEKLKSAGLNILYADLIKIENETEIDGIVEKLKSTTETKQTKLPETFDDFLNADKSFQSEFDRRIGKAIETYKQKQQTPSLKPLGEQNEDKNKEFSELKELVATLAGSVKQQQESLLKAQQTNEAKKLFDNADLPETWFSRIDTSKNIESQIDELKSEKDKFKQDLINEEVEKGNYKPAFGSNRPNDSEFEDYLKNKKQETENNETLKLE